MQHSTNRIFGLDLLRAVAVMLVVQEHGLWMLDPYVYSYRLRFLAYDGVSLFFTLSGFLIGQILIKLALRPDFCFAHLREFWVRRWFRTVPNYFFVVGLLLTAFALSGRSWPANVPAYLLFFQNFATPHPDFFPEAWSLAVEEWFYLLVPIPLFLASKLRVRDRRKVFALVIWGVVLGVAALRIYRVVAFSEPTTFDWDLDLRKQVITRLDSIMYGVAGAYLVVYKSTLWQRYRWAAFAIGIALFVLDKSFTGFTAYANFVKLSVMSIAVLCLLPILSTWRRKNDGITKAVTFISVISYSMYLLNLTVIQMFILPLLADSCAICKVEPALTYFAYWVITIIASAALYYCFERHMTSMRDKNRFRAPELTAAPSI